jgi:hypothetical protein
MENRDEINMGRRVHPEVSGRGQFNKQNPKHVDFGASNRKPFGESSFARLVRQYRANATRRGFAFDLDSDAIRNITSSPCSYCGCQPSQKMASKDSNGHYLYNGIDRKDPHEGYIKGNCVSCCGTCNKAKGKMGYDMWREWLNRVVVYHVAGCVGFKKTIIGDDVPKSRIANAGAVPRREATYSERSCSQEDQHGRD